MNMNAYMLLPQKNVQMNAIPPRLMWNIVDNAWQSSASGYCGETSLLCAGLLYGQYVPQYIVRQLLADYFLQLWGEAAEPSGDLTTMWNLFFGSTWGSSGAPGGDYPNIDKQLFGKLGQYYCQVLPQIWDASSGANNDGFQPLEALLRQLHLSHVQFKPANAQYKTHDTFIPWVKQNVCDGYPAIIGVQDFLAGSNDTDYDHIVLVLGWASNHDLADNSYFADDEIVFSDHGLVVCGRQPFGGSIPYYFRYTMQTETSISATGGWLPDGGCPDPGNPAWNFIMDLGSSREINGQVCNTYQLAQHPGQSSGNAGFAVTGLSDDLPANVKVRIDTDCYYVVPCITTAQAKTGTQPATQQTMTHTISISGLDVTQTYNAWLFVAENAEQLLNVPSQGFNQFGKQTQAECRTISGTDSCTFTYPLAADKALLVRCVPATGS